MQQWRADYIIVSRHSGPMTVKSPAPARQQKSPLSAGRKGKLTIGKKKVICECVDPDTAEFHRCITEEDVETVETIELRADHERARLYINGKEIKGLTSVDLHVNGRETSFTLTGDVIKLQQKEMKR